MLTPVLSAVPFIPTEKNRISIAIVGQSRIQEHRAYPSLGVVSPSNYRNGSGLSTDEVTLGIVQIKE